MTWLPELVRDWGPTGIAGLAVLMVLTGRLVPRSTYQEQVQATAWYRQAYEQQRDAYYRLAAPTAEATVTVLSALPKHPSPPEEP